MLHSYHRLLEKKSYLAVVGLGYVGLPIAIAFARKVNTIGFDIQQKKIELYKQGIDPTGEVGDETIQQTTLEFTAEASRLQSAQVIIVAVPTPINGDKTPDLTPVVEASRMVGKNLSKGSIVVFESTVYPGVTEDICIPILERESGLICGRDFKVGYSPERINPGDKEHVLANITKIISGMDEETVDELAAIYGLVVEVPVYRAPSIKVAEAAKLAENAQRDINIAFMNELAIIFNRMGIQTQQVVEAMNTKWNALRFYPGLVGGHCIGVDPYYFIYKAEVLGYHSQIIAAGRKINDGMVEYITQKVVKTLIQAGKNLREAKVYIMGITFKEDCPDMRNSKAVEICKQLAEYKMDIQVVDPWVEQGEFQEELPQGQLLELEEVKEADCIIFLVKHSQFKVLQGKALEERFKAVDGKTKHVVIDIKNVVDASQMDKEHYEYWSL